MTLTLVDALRALRPNDSFIVRGDIAYENIQLADENKTLPTEQEIEVKLAELKYQEEVNVYQEKRKLEYPNWGDQLDKIYHKGVNAWKADIKKIKDKYPKTQVGITSIAPIPDWVNTALFEKQKEKYLEAKARLAQYELSVGLQDENNNYIIEPLPRYLEEVGINPLIVQDEAEREAAQKIINETPQSVIDSINN